MFFFISGVSIEQPGFHEMQLPPFDFGKTFSLSYLLGKLLCPERTGPCEKAVRSLRRRWLWRMPDLSLEGDVEQGLTMVRMTNNSDFVRIQQLDDFHKNEK